LGKLAKPILDRGEYLPDELMCPILAEWLSRQNEGWVLDGFPRTLRQAIFLDNELSMRGATLDAAVSLEVPFETLLSRMQSRVECPECRWTGEKRQLVSPPEPVEHVADSYCPVCGGAAGPRTDDSEVNFRSRYSEFVNLVLPVIDHYHGLGLLSACDATAPQDEVAARLLRLFPGPSA
jgi:adenylate kinase